MGTQDDKDVSKASSVKAKYGPKAKASRPSPM